MWELIAHPSNLIFSISICLMLLFGILELVLLLLGGGSHGFLEQLLPDDFSAGSNTEFNLDTASSVFGQVLDWLYLGRIPLFVWLIIFLTIYGLSGFILQNIFYSFSAQFFSAWIIAPACLFLSMPLVRYSSMLLAKILPQDESTAIYSEELIGRTALIILGQAKINFPAQAKVKDQFGQMHYVMVEPEQDEIFQQGQSVILTQRTKIGFQAITL